MNVRPPGNGYRQLMDEALRLIAEGESRGWVLRLMGSAAMRYQSGDCAGLFPEANDEPADLDLATYRNAVRFLPGFMGEYGYDVDEEVLALYGRERQVYRHRRTGLSVDVFVDRLRFCHEIDLRGRLDRHPVTISLADLVLARLQKVGATDRDRAGLAELLAAHDVGSTVTSPDRIDLDRIAAVLADDWGFHHTSRMNLEGLIRFTEAHQGLDGDIPDLILARARTIVDRIEQEPKSTRWKLRAKVGTRVKWYTEVEALR